MNRFLELVAEVSEQLKYMKQLAKAKGLDELDGCMGGIELMLRGIKFEKNDDEARRAVAYAMGALVGAYAALGMDSPRFAQRDMFHVLPDGKAFSVTPSIL